MDKQVRIKTNIGKDQVVRVNLKQGVDTFNMLSLTVDSNTGDINTYKKFSSDYGVIVGRVTANNGIGVPNAKLSIFVPLMDVDRNRADIVALYPFDSVNDKDANGNRYNLLPAMYYDNTHVAVGTFPTPQMVLDNDIYVEIFDKYYKYTTVTNNSGDYMLYGVPTGSQTIHMDVDLSDIGFLSQKPSDFMYKGYSSDLFDGGRKFKKQATLDKNPQVLTENDTINVYPFWGDESENEIAITRKDFNLSYEITPSAVFMGSCFTDNPSNYVAENCAVSDNCGNAKQLMTKEGIIEMMRETPDGGIELMELVDGKIDNYGVWCVQVPMNLNYIMTSEEGEIVSTTDTKRGIPTRARVRFKLSLTENLNEVNASHTACYYIPSNYDPNTYNGDHSVGDDTFKFYAYWGTELPQYRGINAKEELMRDMLWNCVYSVKNFIPRYQKVEPDKDHSINLAGGKNHTGLKNVWTNTDATNYNPIPYNKINLDVSSTDVNNESMNTLQIRFAEANHLGVGSLFSVWGAKMMKALSWLVNFVHNQPNELTETYDSIAQNDAAYADTLSATEGAVAYDFYNDWLNGSLYFPRIAYHINENNELVMCQCGEYVQKQGELFYATDTCALDYVGANPSLIQTAGPTRFYIENACFKQMDGDHVWSLPYESGDGINNFYQHSCNIWLEHGFVFAYQHRAGTHDYTFSYSPFVRNSGGRDCAIGFKTDFILLGSVDDNNIFGIPNIVNLHLPITTCHKVPMFSSQAIWNPNIEIINPNGQDVYTEDGDAIKLGKFETEKFFGTYTQGFINPYPSNQKFDSNDRWYSATVKSMMSNSDFDAMSRYFGTEYRINGAFWGSAEYTPWIALTTSAIRTYSRNSLIGGSDRYISSPHYFVDYGTTSEADTEINITDSNPTRYDYGRHCILGQGLFFGRNAFTINSNVYVTKPKSAVNLARICELSVTNENSLSFNENEQKWVSSDTTGIIGEDQITCCQYRSLFATLNSDTLISDNSGLLPKYNLRYLNINGFDGTLNGHVLKWHFNPQNSENSINTAIYYEKSVTDYKNFRYGKPRMGDGYRTWFRYWNTAAGTGRGINTTNSFYFYFGLNAEHTALHELSHKYW